MSLSLRALLRFLLLVPLAFSLTLPGAGPALAAQTQIASTEYDALVALYNATDGANWTNTWTLPTDSPCSLYGVGCMGGHVVQLSLAENQLCGEIPTTLRDLAFLQNLILSGNQLRGTIPGALGDLVNLRTLDLGSNGLSGEIPAELASLSNLRELMLSSNLLSGEIPLELGNLSSLDVLSLGSNQLSGPIPAELGGLSNLGLLSLGSNQLSGQIPPELGGLEKVTLLFLGSNQLSGSIPAALADLTSLRALYLHDNRLTGPIPQEIGRLTSLGWLHVDRNGLSGAIPAEIGDMAELVSLNLAHNALMGPVPSRITRLTSLGMSGPNPEPVVDLGHNRLWSSDPVVRAFLDAKDPDWASTQDAVVVQLDPGSVEEVGMIGDTGQGGTITVPAGAVTETTTLVYTPQDAPSASPAGMAFAGRAFSLEAYRDEVLLPDFTFAQPVTLTLEYTDAEVAGLDERTLTLHTWDGAAWVDAAATCRPASAYLREPAENRLSVALCHLSEYALFGKQPHVYLPLMIR